MKTFSEAVNRMKEIQRIDSNKPGQDAAAKQREARKSAANRQVADAERRAQATPPDKEQAAKDREARKAAANKQVADAERKASPITSKSSRLGGTGGRKTMTSTARPANTMSKPKSRPVTTATTQTNNPAKTPKDNVSGSADRLKAQREADRKEADRKRNAEAEGARNIAKRKQGTTAGVKSALGGDVIGMRGRRGETPEEKKQRQNMNKKNRGDFAKKKVQQTGNVVKSAPGKALNLTKNIVKGSEEDRTKVAGPSGDVSGGSQYQSRSQRG